jgi:predicted O-methyltransferase YrrM
MLPSSAYSFDTPLVDPREVSGDEHRIWKANLTEMPGVDMRRESQLALLVKMNAFAKDFDYPRTVKDRRKPYEFYQDNGLFEGLDARMWFCLARYFRPRRIVEVGGGFSSLLAANINRRYFESGTAVISIDPHPSPAVLAGVPGLSKVLPFRVQQVPMQLFAALRKNDVLFIDSSHISKTGSDVNFMCLEVLPRLAPGVLIHFHDIFLPGEYPKEWVLERGYSWNEQYLVHALLIDSVGFEIVFASLFASTQFPDKIHEVFGDSYTGGSLWLRRTTGARA